MRYTLQFADTNQHPHLSCHPSVSFAPPHRHTHTNTHAYTVLQKDEVLYQRSCCFHCCCFGWYSCCCCSTARGGFEDSRVQIK